jgi:ribonuclease R
LVRFPTHFHEGEGVITQVLGPRGAPGVDTLSIIMEFGLPQEFSEAVLDSAREQAEKFNESIGADRLDCTEDVVITIDPVDARDFDDAISLTRLENGHWLLGVHIADVAHFVPEDTLLDREARDRATSVYLPDQVIPMLPEIISNNLASLQPDKLRYARTAYIEMTPDGARVNTEVHSTAIKSRRRFSYEEVDEFLADREAWREKLTPDVFDLLENMHELAMILRRRRLEGGAIEMHLPEVKIDLDKFGRVTGAHVVESTESHQIIEEFMLGANEAVAERLSDDEILFLRRIHESPDPRKLQSLTTFVRELGIECESLESRYEIKRVLELTSERPEAYAINYAVLRSMSKAIYGPSESGHYALAMDNYCHFTSPIRRYPDLTVHRLYDQIAKGKKVKNDFDALALFGDHCSEREQRAEKAERELKKAKLLNYMSKKIGFQMEAVVTGVEEFGLFVQGIEIPAEGLLHVQALGDDYYHYDKPSHTLMGHKAGNQFRLGDRLQVEVARVDLDRREIDFRLAANQPRKESAEKKSAPAGSSSRKTSSGSGSERKRSRKKSTEASGTDRTRARKKSTRKTDSAPPQKAKRKGSKRKKS